ncbi:transferrin-binding protein-like solute binding protein [Yoonia sp. BS5-3]|uniref:Transferrin-binding protein-like solute binding protein n=1 Tax=Yoonia phaeophyticola TaxID=3137369 RepID=A0ABZ2UZS3_9RHOB
MLLKKYLLCVGAAALSACMASDEAETTQTALSFAELNTLNTEIIDEIVAIGATPVDDIPTTGSATYDGTMLLALQDGSMDGAIGQAQMVTSFATSTITGGADNFYDLNGNAIDGSLTLEDGSFERTIGIVTGEMNGSVDFASGEMDIETDVAGNFSGPNAEYLSGVMTGTATPEGEDALVLIGGFYLEQ